jgi:GxxExxY protein
MQDETLTGAVIGCAMRVHGALGPGYLESVYQNALAHELGRSSLSMQREARIEVRYRDVVVGRFVADFLVEEKVLVEVKAVCAMASTHDLQVVNYLTATGLDVGLLLNFGAQRLEFRRKTRRYRPGGGGKGEQQTG